MHDATPHVPEDSSAPNPFGAGIPAEPVEPVRLPPGGARGPTLEVRGESRSRQDPAGGPIPPIPHSASSAGSPESGSPSFATPPPPQPAAASTSTPPPGYTQPPAGSNPPPPNGPGSGLPPTPPSAKPLRRGWIALAHLAFLIPFPPGVLITAALWIWRRARDPLMADQGREALNMQLTFWLAIGLLGATCFSSPLVPFVYVLGAVLCVLAAISAANGDRHRYPWVFRFLT
jgi:uncharacterized Tic20 family protein